MQINPQANNKNKTMLFGLVKSGTWFLLIFSFLFSSLAYSQFLEPYSARYVALRNGSKIGHAELDLERLEDKSFKLRFYSYASLFLIYDKREELSFFEYNDERLIPHKYSFDRKSTFKDNGLALEFDQENSLIQVSKKDKTNSMEWKGELDHQLYLLAAQKLLSKGKTEFEFDLINYRGEKKHYKFKVEGEETLNLPYGKLNAIKVKTVRQNSTRVTYSWFAPELHYILVRFQQFKEGSEQGDILLSEYKEIATAKAAMAN